MTSRVRPPARLVLQHALSQPWAITPEALTTILEIAARAHDAEAALEAIAAKYGAPLKPTQTVTVRDGVATLPVIGPMFRYADFFSAISGATTYEAIATDFTAALEDPSVEAIVLMLDSPGGEVNGMAELAELIYGARGTKPIVAMASGMTASAAYFLAAAADQIVAGPTAILGSIGVRLGFMDTRKRDEAKGVRPIEIISSQSPRKGMDPTTDTGRADLQAVADELAQVFIESVARFRAIEPTRVAAEFGQGGVFVGESAVRAGLADRLGTYESVHAELVQSLAGGGIPPLRRVITTPGGYAAAAHAQEAHMDKPTTPPGGTAAAAAAATPAEPAKTFTPAELTAQHPEAAAALRAEGAAVERARIQAIEALALPGHEELIAAAKADGTATAESTAVKILQAQKAKPATPAAPAAPGATHLANLAGDEAKANAPAAAVPAEPQGEQALVAQMVSFSTLRPRPATPAATTR